MRGDRRGRSAALDREVAAKLLPQDGQGDGATLDAEVRARRDVERDLGAADVRALRDLLGRIARGSGRTELASEELVASALGR